MAKSRRRSRWVEIYNTEVPGQAGLIATLLDTHGMAAKITRRRSKNTPPQLRLVRVAPRDAEQARSLLTQRRIGDSST